jgi:hypothetical protein
MNTDKYVSQNGSVLYVGKASTIMQIYTGKEYEEDKGATGQNMIILADINLSNY